MTPSEYKKMKEKQLHEQKVSVHQKISNNFIDNAINKNNINAIKTVFYLASILDDFDFAKEIVTLEIDLRKMFKYTEMTAQEVRHNLKAMQQTAITFINEKEEWEEHIVLVPRIEFLYGKNIVKVDMYSKIAKLVVDVKNNYTPINTKTLMTLKSKYSIRLLPLLNTISRYDEDYEKIRKFDLESINEFFGTKYKTFTDIKRKVLDIAKEELDNNSSLTFDYEMITEKLGHGRPKITGIKIKPKAKSNYQSTIFSNFQEQESEQLKNYELYSQLQFLLQDIELEKLDFYKERLQEFCTFVVENNKYKQYSKDWFKSFDRHVQGYIKSLRNNDIRL